jgi:hypothetical protein
MKNTKSFSLFAVFSSYKDITTLLPSGFQLIVSKYFVDNSRILDYSTMCDYLHIFNIVRLIIVTVTKNPNLNHTHEIVYTGRNHSTSTIITNIIVPSNDFFSKYGIEKYIIDQNIKMKLQTESSLPYDDSTWKDSRPAFVVYKFENYSYFEVLTYFKKFNIKISGGVKTRRDDFSTTHLRMAYFIICLENCKSFHTVWNSFHNTSILDRKTFLDFSNNKSLDEMNKELLSLQQEVDQNKNIELENNQNNFNSSPFTTNGQTRKYHSSSKNNLNLENSNISILTPHSERKRNFSSTLHLSDNQNNSLKYFDEDILKFKNILVNSFIKNYINNPLYYKIRLTLEDIELNYSKKQEFLEETLTEFWRKEIVALFRDNQKLFRSEYGIKFIYNNIIKLDRDIQDLKDDKRSLKGKKYKNLLILMSNPDIISIVLSNVIPFCIKYENILDQNVVGLFEKIGKEIEKMFYRIEWYSYLKRNKKDWKDKSDTVLNNHYIVNIKNHEITITDSLDTKGVIFEDKLNENDFIEKLKILLVF